MGEEMAQQIKAIVSRGGADLFRDALGVLGLFAMLFVALNAPGLF